MAVFVCLRQMLCVQHNPADYCREICCLSRKTTSVSVSGTHSLLFSPSHSCINMRTHTQRIQESHYPKQDGHVWVVRSQCDILFLSASSSGSIGYICVPVHLCTVPSETVNQRSLQVQFPAVSPSEWTDYWRCSRFSIFFCVQKRQRRHQSKT